MAQHITQCKHATISGGRYISQLKVQLLLFSISCFHKFLESGFKVAPGVQAPQAPQAPLHWTPEAGSALSTPLPTYFQPNICDDYRVQGFESGSIIWLNFWHSIDPPWQQLFDNSMTLIQFGDSNLRPPRHHIFPIIYTSKIVAKKWLFTRESAFIVTYSKTPLQRGI